MKERRKALFCGPKHRLTPTLSALANAIQYIINECEMDKDGVRLITDTNYASKIRSIGIFARLAASEVDKLIMIDNKEVERKEVEEKRGEKCVQ